MLFRYRKLSSLLPALMVSAILITACGPETTRPDNTNTAPDARALQYITSHQYLDGAVEYMKLAGLYPERQTEYRLDAARAYYLGGDAAQARSIAIATQIDAHDNSNILRRKILLARLSLEENDPEAAIAALGRKPAAASPEDMVIEYHEVRASAYELKGDSIRAVKEYLVLSGLQHDPGTRTTEYRKIWSTLNHLNVRELNRLHKATSGKLTSWIELAIIYQSNLFKPELLQQELAIWKDHYPDHPANAFLLGEILQTSRSPGVLPKHIALCLPFLEPYKQYSEAIRDGFISAWYASEHYRPVVNIYNADSLNIQEVYRIAVDNGADFIVGPLEKEAIARLMELQQLPVTTLALNQYSGNGQVKKDPDHPYPKLLRFDLSPEDEARQAADRASGDGAHRALVIAPEGDWGGRLVQAFSSKWASDGGRVIDAITYPADTTDFSAPVKRLLNITGSEYRARLLQQRLNKRIKSETRIRQDADMIFLVADPAAARQIVPQLRFFRAGGLPVYSTRFLYSGTNTAKLDNDINDVIFPDFPWVIDPASSMEPVHRIIDDNWSANTSRYNRMYALGVDAFRLIPNLQRLADQPSVTYAGETGNLYLTDDGTVRRKLLWARVVNGKPQLITGEIP